MSNIDQGELIISLLSKNYDTHMNIVWATIALLLASIGWIITSSEARNYLTSYKFSKTVSLVVIVAIAVIHYSILWESMETSKILTAELLNVACNAGDIKNIKDKGVFIYLILPLMFYARSAVTLILFGFLGFLVMKSGKNT